MDTESHEAAILQDAERLAAADGDAWETLHQVCVTLASRVHGYDWVGFYLVDPLHPRDLVLGPYVGDPTEHVRIPFGVGICGQAAEAGQPFLVADVAREGNYLACSLKVKSEIVVPVWREGRVAGELDIDSHQPNRFSDEDRKLLEAVCARIAPVVERCRYDPRIAGRFGVQERG
ncbi:MAG: GAF domain-containing protein [Candidatus Eisenbacteria bacterium]|jgi:GAF domain-containing protein|nr:GAF domain-containing protein [Candidatus Eisenbacteria bacterium]